MDKKERGWTEGSEDGTVMRGVRDGDERVRDGEEKVRDEEE